MQLLLSMEGEREDLHRDNFEFFRRRYGLGQIDGLFVLSPRPSLCLGIVFIRCYSFGQSSPPQRR